MLNKHWKYENTRRQQDGVARGGMTQMTAAPLTIAVDVLLWPSDLFGRRTPELSGAQYRLAYQEAGGKTVNYIAGMKEAIIYG